MLPVICGDIVHRILLNYRADPSAVAKTLPNGFELDLQGGFAVVGICVIEFSGLRPVGMPRWSGLSSANAAHRVAVRFKDESGWRTGVYIWRRDTNSCLTTLLGGRLFPGVQGSASVSIVARDNDIQIDVRTARRDADVVYRGGIDQSLHGSTLFPTIDEASAFFQRGDCGYSCASSGAEFEGMRLKIEKWNMQPLATRQVSALHYDDANRFPAGSIAFDCALLMTNLPHQWVSLPSLPTQTGTLAK